MRATAFGIDFGTTNSVVAAASASRVEAIQLDDGLPAEWASTGFDLVLPSVIGMNGGKPSFGWAAKKSLGDKLEAVKRLFATDDTITIGSTTLGVEEAAAIFFRHLQSRISAAGIPSALDRAVVTIPANSRGKARYRTKLSAGLAGIEVMALINEPTAAAMAHARSIGQNQRILVFDWGGGTLDVTVLQAVEGTFIEQSSKGIQRLGGIDVDAAFLSSLSGRIPEARSWEDHERALFKLNLELAKIQLSTRRETQVALPRGGFFEITRPQFEEAVKPLVDRTREPVEICLRESPGRIDHLVMVGGSSKMPIIQDFVSNIVGTEASDGVNPMTAIAEGAAIAAGILLEVIEDVDFYVGTEHALGTIVHNHNSPLEGDFSALIRRNTKLPASATDSYMPGMDHQESVRVEVIEGDPSLPIGHEDNVILKDWVVPLLEPRPMAEAGFDITYEYDVDGILHVRIRDHKTGTIMMDDELAFGAGEDRSKLPGMRRRVDDLMAGSGEPAAAPRHDVPAPANGLSRESVAVLQKTRDKVLPFVTGTDQETLERLTRMLEQSVPAAETACREELLSELRRHSYLL